MTIKWGAVQTLAGGMMIGASDTLGSMPGFMVSPLWLEMNERHALRWLEKRGWSGPVYPDIQSVPKRMSRGLDLIVSVPFCKGVSNFNRTSSPDNTANENMLSITGDVLSHMKPPTFIYENSARIISQTFKPLLNKIRKISSDAGYSCMIFITKSYFFSNPQNRARSYFIFRKRGMSNSKLDIPVSSPVMFEEWIRNQKFRDDDWMAGMKIRDIRPSEEHDYRMIAETTGITDHRQMVELAPAANSKTLTVILLEMFGRDEKGFSKILEMVSRIGDKSLMIRWRTIRNNLLFNNKGYWDHRHRFLRGRTGSFIGACPKFWIHPWEDRYLNFREMARIMGMPEDFEMVMTPGNDKLNEIQALMQNVGPNVAGPIVSAAMKPGPHISDWFIQFHYNGRIMDIDDSPICSLENFI